MKYGFLWIIILAFGCQSPPTELNPAAPGFLASQSDAKAIELADEVMVASGGRKNWDQVTNLHWVFFGKRSLDWNKKTGDVSIVDPKEKMEIKMNIFSNEGTVTIDGQALTAADSLGPYLVKGKNIWINDSYWLVMPFKLKDSGVQLKYQGQQSTQKGVSADVIELTFEKVGSTPQNKYLVYIDPTSKLVTQWDYYGNANDEKPAFQMPWEDYQTYGGIKLSGKRGENRFLSEIKID